MQCVIRRLKKIVEHTKNKNAQSFTLNSSLKHIKSILTPCEWSLWTLSSQCPKWFVFIYFEIQPLLIMTGVVQNHFFTWVIWEAKCVTSC